MDRSWQLSSREKALWPILVSVFALVAFYTIGGTFLVWYRLDLGSTTLPTARYTAFLFYWTLLGSLAAFFLILGLTRMQLLRAPTLDARALEDAPGDRVWIAGAMAVAFLLPWALRIFLLRGAVLTDDESAYRFMGQVLASGRLWAESHPMRQFLDRAFMVNDGKFYATYFLGWPALMAPGVYLNITGYMNAIYAALTVPALYQLGRRLAGRGAARVVTILFLTSPMLMVGAATELSHTTCMMALTWSMYFLLRALERPGAWLPHAGLAFFFSLAFLVRPTSALGLGLPFIAWWSAAMVRWPGATRRRALISFAVPAIVMAAVFLGVNAAQNGSPFLTSYVRLQQYMREVGYRNTGWTAGAPPVSIAEYILPNMDLGVALAKTTVALVRLIFDLFGSPLLVLLMGLAWATKPARLPALAALVFVAVHFFMFDSGIDSFGPVHYFEMSLPLLLLCGIGFARLAEIAREKRPDFSSAWPGVVVASVVVVSLIGFAPTRLWTLRLIAANVNAPLDTARKAGVSNAVVFTNQAFISQTCISPTRHFVYFRPNNDPALKNDILWVNDLGREQNREFMRYFPGRTAYVMTWESCRPLFGGL